MQVRVSPEINEVLDAAAELSTRRGRYYVGVEHVYEVLLDRSNLLPQKFVDAHQKTLHAALKGLSAESWQGAAPSPGEIFYTPRCGNATHEAARLAERLHSSQLQAGHLLLALLLDSGAAPSRALDRLNLNRDALTAQLRVELSGNAASRPQAAPQKGQAVAEAAPAGQPAQQKVQAQVQDAEPQAGAGEPVASLDSLTHDLTAAAARGEIDPAIGRDDVVMQIMEILSRKAKNNLILVGEAGVGKTKVVEGLALLAVQGGMGGILSGMRILELSVGTLMAGTQYRGALEEKLRALLDELKKSKDIILFIDEIHLIMGAGSTDGDGIDVANLLKPALARSELRCIGATTIQEYRKFIEKDPAVERRFQMVRIEALSDDATYELLKKMRGSLEKHHRVHISRKIIKETISLTNRYLPNRQQPDKAIDVMDQACARYRLKLNAAKQGIEYSRTGLAAEGKNEVTLHEVRKVVSQLTGIPLQELTSAERMRLEDLEAHLNKRIIGQDEAVRRAVSAVKKSRAGLADPNRPDAVMLFLGPSGVGKTQLAKELSESLFGSTDHLITFDMTEYVEEHSVSKLLGAPPGYVGSEEEGRLTSAVRSAPFSILLFDEVEKAHPRIFDIFLPIFDEGRIKDSRGRVVSFRNCIIILTSNIGADALMAENADPGRSTMINALGEHFRPEFINRIDEIVPFYALLYEDIRLILRNAMVDLAKRLREKDISLRVYEKAYEHIADAGYNRQFGARELKRAVDRLVITPISEMVLRNEFSPGGRVEVSLEGDELRFISLTKEEKERQKKQEREAAADE